MGRRGERSRAGVSGRAERIVARKGRENGTGSRNRRKEGALPRHFRRRLGEVFDSGFRRAVCSEQPVCAPHDLETPLSGEKISGLAAELAAELTRLLAQDRLNFIRFTKIQPSSHPSARSVTEFGAITSTRHSLTSGRISTLLDIISVLRIQTRQTQPLHFIIVY